MPTIKVVCAWCDSEMDSRECEDEGFTDRTSHGMCEECAKVIREQMKEDYEPPEPVGGAG